MLFNFKFKPFTVVLLLLATCTFAQTGIGTTTPNASAKLDVYSDNKGFLPPRVTLTSTTDNTTVPNAAEGLLVYNKGSVGLQAGYYYWNGANWATIATATSAGNGVTSMDMVKLYSKAYSTTAGDIANASGYSFTVPVSGRYLFDFSSTGYINQASFTFTFSVRQGTTVLASDFQTSANNNVHVEYNGKLEVNLQSGITYNVYVNSTGSRDSGDSDRVYYKLVAGNLPVTGQTVDYVSVSTINQTSVGVNRDLIFTNNNGGNIPYNTTTGVFTLSANKTYLFQAQIRANTPSADANYIEYGFVDATTNSLLVDETQTITTSTTSTSGFGSNPVVNFIYTPTVNQTVKLRTIGATRGTQRVLAGTANITQIGSSAIINPWTLSGTNTYNITGNVGIGTNSPDASAILDLSSTTQGLLIPRMTATQRAAISSPTTGLTVFQTDANAGNYIYNGSSWQVLSNANYGDVKTGFQSNDHNGWIKLNGRLKSTLTASQQTQANLLGIGTNLPNADNSVLMQSSSGTFGIVNGSNSKTITQANLPSYNLPAATSSSNGDHTHWISAATIDNRDFDGTPNNFQQFGLVSDTGSYSINDANRSIGRNTLNAGTHNHNVTVSSGGSGTALDVTPQYLKINTFIYLGF